MRTSARGVAALAVLLGALVLEGSAEAKDLTGRVGVGYENSLVGGGAGVGLSGVAARYYATPQLLLNAQFGVLMIDPDASGADSQNSFGLGVGGGYVFIDEPNLNLYGGAGLAFGQVPGPNDNGTGTEGKTAIGLNAGVGMEFFFVGLPNLGFTAQYGLTYASVSDVASTIAIGGGDFATFGIRYYFGGPKGPDSP